MLERVDQDEPLASDVEPKILHRRDSIAEFRRQRRKPLAVSVAEPQLENYEIAIPRVGTDLKEAD